MLIVHYVHFMNALLTVQIPGIVRDKTIDERFIFTLNYDKHYWLKRSNIANQDILEVPKVFKSTNERAFR